MKAFDVITCKSLGLLLTLVIAVCDPASLPEQPAVAVLDEAWMSEWSQVDNIDSPAVWHGPEGQHWVIATAKSTHQLLVYDAVDGSLVRRIGGAGTGPGQLQRPNGVVIIDDMVLVVERDNHRVQAFTLPDLLPAGEFGGDVLRRPYGIAAAADTAVGSFQVFITDNYLTASGEVPRDNALGERVRSFTGTVVGRRIHAVGGSAFGDTSGHGCLRKVESIGIDPLRQWLVIAEEQEGTLKIYSVDGRFSGLVVGAGLFQREPEGLTLHTCADGGGYWVVVDQAPSVNRFLLFRRSDFTYVGAFEGQVAAHTDGVALTQQSFAGFNGGAFYAVHHDGGLAAFDWSRVLSDLGLDPACGG